MSDTANFIFSDGIAYLPKSNSIVQMAKEGPMPKVPMSTSSGKPATEASSPKIFDLLSIGLVAYWGTNNLFPQDLVSLAEQSTELPALLHWKAKAAQGAMVLPYYREYNETSKEWDEVPIKDSDILSFFLSSTTKRYVTEAYTDFYWFWNVFPDLIKNEDGDKIVYIGTHDATWCRWFKQNDNGIVEKVAISSAWQYLMDKDTKYAMQLDVVNPYDWNLVDNLKAETSIKRFVYPTSYPSPGKSYYQLAPWDGFRSSGWMNLASQIPAFKEAIMKNAINPKYKWSVPTSFWKETNSDWDTLTQDEKVARKKAKLLEIDTALAGVDNAGKTILAEVKYDEVNREIVPGWNLELIQNVLQDGAYIEDSQEASAHLLRALNLDGTLVGQGPGRDLNAGGGSDKLIAYNMYVALLGPERQVVEEPLYFIARYNGWIDSYPTFFIKTIEAAPKALDTSKKVSNQVQQQNGNNG